MNRVLLAALITVLAASTSGAVVQGFPDSAQITAINTGGGRSYVLDTVSFSTTPQTLDPTPGTTNAITMSGTSAQITVTYLFDSFQSAYVSTTGTNLAIYLGVPGSTPADS